MKTGSSLFTKSLATGLLVAAVCACGPEKSQSSGGGAESAGGEPSIVISDQAEWDELAEAGKTSFDTACGDCHPGGEKDLGPELKGEKIASSKMVTQIREGSGQMKPIGEDKLPEAEMKGLLVYLATLNAVGDVKGP
jgi:mono/diheme cytochrome c family protein